MEQTLTYVQMLAGRGMKIGDQVLNEYRMPHSLQWWIHPVWVGVIEDVSRDKDTWNSRNTEENYCVACHVVKVRYLASGDMAGHTQHDSLGSLRQLHFGTVSESPYFDSRKASKRALYEFACRAGFGDLYCDVLRIPPPAESTTAVGEWFPRADGWPIPVPAVAAEVK